MINRKLNKSTSESSEVGRVVLFIREKNNNKSYYFLMHDHMPNSITVTFIYSLLFIFTWKLPLFSLLFYKQGNGGSERLSDLDKVTPTNNL